MNKNDLQQIRTLIEEMFEKHLGAVHEEISVLTENTNDISSEIAELRKDLEHRLRSALPDLPEAARS